MNVENGPSGHPHDPESSDADGWADEITDLMLKHGFLVERAPNTPEETRILVVSDQRGERIALVTAATDARPDLVLHELADLLTHDDLPAIGTISNGDARTNPLLQALEAVAATEAARSMPIRAAGGFDHRAANQAPRSPKGRRR